jgi:membrane associated rhomboid family serine protease
MASERRFESGAGYILAAVIPATSLIPIHDENPTRTFSYLTAALIAVNVAVFLLEPEFGIGESQATLEFLCRWGTVPFEVTRGEPNCLGSAVPDKNIYLSLITSMFLHGGPLHLGGNMLFLWVFGNNIEDVLGRIKYLLFYLVTGLAASFAHIATDVGSTVPAIGASGAISGLLGAYIVLFPRARVTTIAFFLFIQVIKLPAMVVLGLWFATQFLIGLTQQAGGGGVAWMAHVGGFVAGALLIFVFGGRPRRVRWWRPEEL